MKNLKILQEGEIGYGVLVEKDAGETTNKLYTKTEVLKEGFINEVGITSSVDNNITRILIDCILQKANVQNRNGRIYPKNLLEREVKKYMQLIEDSAAFGETNHPDNPVISLKKDELSHLIRKFWWEGDVLYGTLELITTDKYHKDGGVYCIGDFVATLLKRGYKLGISSRGLGSLKNIGGKNYVQDDFELICWDLVSSPSTPGAYLFTDTKSINENYNILKTNENKKEKFLKFLNKN